MASEMFYGATPQLFEYAKQLREAVTHAELVLWESLRMNKLNGFRFKAQYPISSFVADFLTVRRRSVTRLNWLSNSMRGRPCGGVHDPAEQQEYDASRTYVLEELGVRVIRFKNEEVFDQLDKVLAEIARFLPSHYPPP